jgi:hypothetical protein
MWTLVGTDSDAEGLPDHWKLDTFSNLMSANEASDFDGDAVESSFEKVDTH